MQKKVAGWKMIKVVFVFSVSQSHRSFKQLAQEQDILDVSFVADDPLDRDRVEKIYRCKPDIVVCRGLLAMEFRTLLPNIHIIPIDISGYDILEACLKSAAVYHRKKIAIVLPALTGCNIDILRRATKFELDVCYITDRDEAPDAVERALSRGYKSVVGGYTVGSFCKNRGVDFIPIAVSDICLQNVFHETLSMARTINTERSKGELIRSILQNITNALVAVDQNGFITAYNQKFVSILHLEPKNELSGKMIEDVFPELGWRNPIVTRLEDAVVIDVYGSMMVLSRIPIIHHDECVGVQLSFQDHMKIREADNRIRKELLQKGLVAKYHFENIIHVSTPMKRCIEIAKRYGSADSNILIIGETGTGKELLAHSIHNHSVRKNQAFVAINCAALPENLLESELFGYVGGAFTGATKTGKMGLFEQAHKGTIFLDEIGEISISLQAKLLRVLQEREIRRIGDNCLIPIDVRVISATNINIGESLRLKKFREDLYYRLNILSLCVPPLRERREDISVIAKYYIDNLSNGKVTITSDALILLSDYPWAGNVRELQNVCERAVVLDTRGEITQEDVRDILNTMSAPSSEYFPAQSPYCEKNTTQSEIAKRLGISRTTLWRRKR
jgi:propionate catabolism operon transcriptional regulator